MKKNSLFKGAALLSTMLLLSGCGKSSPLTPTTSDTASGDTSPTEPAVIESEFSCRKAREAAPGTEITVEGIVAKITTNDMQSPDGFMLIDDFASIYVYGASVAEQVSVGNKVKVKGTKEFFIAETEKSLAEKYGYNGANQVSASELLFDDEKNHDFPTNWIQHKTIKEALNTPVTEDFATVVFRTEAIIKRSQGQGFVNYYIDDLDGKTGSYVYTKSSGADIDKSAELKQYDGKTVMLYMTCISAKMTANGTVWRFIPIKIIDDSYEFPLNKVSEFTLEYYVKDLFADTYYADPALEVPATVSNDVIPFEGVAVTYTSSNATVASFADEDGKKVFHMNANGNATITAEATYNNNGKEVKASINVDVKREAAPEVETITVAQAKAAAVDEIVTVKGIVGPSLVNQKGFYLIDDTGTIAITTLEDIAGSYAIGNEVILKGKRDLKYAQIFLSDCECVVNFQGKHAYSTASFKNAATVAEFTTFTDSQNHTNEVYVVTASFKKVVSQYSTNYYLTDDPTTKDGLGCYASSGGQYAWLDSYLEGQYKITAALCAWNSDASRLKTCILSVEDSAGNIVYNDLNFR